MVLKVDFGGVPVEIWFTPSFNIKTADKRVEELLRRAELEVFDPWEMRRRKARVTKSLRDAFLVIDEYAMKVPELKISFKEAPKVENHFDRGTNESPVLH
jgi:hypothetical protein